MYYGLEKKYKYDDKRIVAEFSVRRSMKKERLGIELNRRILEQDEKSKRCVAISRTTNTI